MGRRSLDWNEVSFDGPDWVCMYGNGIWGMFGIDGMQVAYTFLSLHWYTATPVQYFS